MFQKKMSSCIMKTQDSDEEVDLEALRLAALKSRKPKYPGVNHNNLIPIVPVAVETPDFVNTKVKVEKISPVREIKDENKTIKENEDEKTSNYSGFTLENDQDFLSMDDKEEEDSLERLMDQLEAEISGKAPTPTNKPIQSKVLSKENTENSKIHKKDDKDGCDDEIELVQVKTGKEPNAIIEIRESSSPCPPQDKLGIRKSLSPKSIKSSSRRSISKLRSRSRSPFYRGRSYRRSRSPYWSRSPRRSRSPFRRSRSPYWSSRWSRSKSRSPFRRYRSPVRKRSQVSRFSRSRSISYDRRSPWSLSPRKRSKSPLYHDELPSRNRNLNSPERPRRSFSPRKSSQSPRRRSRSPRRYLRDSPYRRSKSPFRRSRSPFRRSSVRRSQSPFIHRSKSPFSKLYSPNRSPVGRKYSKFPNRRFPKPFEKVSSKPRSKSPVRKYGTSTRSPGRLKVGKNSNINASPPPRRNHSPIKLDNKNKTDGNEKVERSEKLPEDNEDALSINLEGNLWDESEESEDECESRFKSNEARKNRFGTNNRIVLSFRNLRDGDTSNKRNILNKPLTNDNRRDGFRREKYGSVSQSKKNDRNDRKRRVIDGRNEEKDSIKNKSKEITSQSSSKSQRRSDRKPIVWSLKNEPDPKDNEVSTTQSEAKENQNRSTEKHKLNKDDPKTHETDDFDKLISDFEKELESDTCFSAKIDKNDVKKPKITVKKDLSNTTVKKPISRIVKTSEVSSNTIDKSCESKTNIQLSEIAEKVEVEKPHQASDGPEDYIEDDDFVLEVSASRKHKSKGEDEDNQSDLRAVLSRRRNERLTKAVSLQENMPTRLVQSAFQGLGNNKSRRQVQDTPEFPLVDKTSGAEGRRVLVLHREKNPVSSLKCNMPEVKPDTTIHQKFTRSNPRRKRMLQRQLDSIDDMDQEEEEPEGFEVEEEKQCRRFRLKRNVTLSSQTRTSFRVAGLGKQSRASNQDGPPLSTSDYLGLSGGIQPKP